MSPDLKSPLESAWGHADGSFTKQNKQGIWHQLSPLTSFACYTVKNHVPHKKDDSTCYVLFCSSLLSSSSATHSLMHPRLILWACALIFLDMPLVPCVSILPVYAGDVPLNFLGMDLPSAQIQGMFLTESCHQAHPRLIHSRWDLDITSLRG